MGGKSLKYQCVAHSYCLKPQFAFRLLRKLPYKGYILGGFLFSFYVLCDSVKKAWIIVENVLIPALIIVNLSKNL